MKLLQSRGILGEPERTPTKLRIPGPMTGQDATSDGAYILAHGIPAEIAAFRKKIEARAAKAMAPKVMVCSNRGCTFAKGVWMAGSTPSGTTDPMCNWNGLKDGGHLFDATPEQAKAFKDHEAAASARWKAGAAERKRRTREFNRRHAEDAHR